MSRRLLSSLLLVSALSLGACAPSMQKGGARPQPQPVVVVTPKPVAPAIDRAKLRTALESRRRQTLDRFLAFREARVYPVNTVSIGYQHIWMDPFGNLCAAATLISLDWGRPASEAISLEDNGIKLADVHDGPIADWMLTSGMTHHEIVAIQGPDFAGREYQIGEPAPPEPVDPVRVAEVERLYQVWTDVERQITQLWDENLDEATDALMAHPELARQLLDGVAAGPGKYGEMTATLERVERAVVPEFAQPPQG